MQITRCSRAAGAPPLFSALMLGFFGNLMASTHTIVVVLHLFFTRRLRHSETLVVMNLALGVVYFVIWLGLGSLWMKLIGLM